MTTTQLIQHLDRGLTIKDLEALDSVQLGKLEGLFYHWQRVCESQIASRFQAQKDEASE